jgi:hypothetical protein
VSTQYFRFSVRHATDRLRSDLLERLLARSDQSTAIVDWRADAFHVIAPQAPTMPGLSAVALFAASGAVGEAWVFFATPVRYVAEMSNVRMATDGILSLSHAEAETLAGDFNRVWHDAGIRLMTGRSAELFCVVEQPLPATTRDPEDVLDRHIDNYLPSGAGAARLRQLMSEIEMWLFDHAVNRTRMACDVPQVTGLWLWGGGATLASLPSVQGWTAGNDPFFGSFPGAGTGAADGADSGVIVAADAPGTEAWREVESRWIEPALEQLRFGRLSRVELSAGDRCFSLSARWSWRFWRRRRPWWEAFT